MAEEKSLTDQLSELKSGLHEHSKTYIDAELKKLSESVAKIEGKVEKKDFDALQSTLNEIKSVADSLTQWKVTKDEADQKNQEAIDKLLLQSKEVQLPNNGKQVKSFNDLIGEAIMREADTIKNHRKGAPPLKIDLMPEIKQVGSTEREVKAVGDMSIANNFTNATALYQDVRPLIQTPYDAVWLSDILPGGTSNGTQLTYPKENGGEGAAALWEDPTEDKPQMDFDLTSANVPFKWIAGIVIVDRSMLDDIAFLTSYIQNKMLISLKTAENAFILNGANVSPTVDGLLDVATAYNGTYNALIDKVIDAAYGQIVEDTEQFYRGNTVVMMPRAAVSIGLNKSGGSSEYDLPEGSAAFANGLLQLAGLQTVTATSIGSGNWLAFDKRATMFVRRMVPELRTFEDAALAKKNKLMFRIEERATLAIFNDSAIISGDTSES